MTHEYSAKSITGSTDQRRNPTLDNSPALSSGGRNGGGATAGRLTGPAAAAGRRERPAGDSLGAEPGNAAALYTACSPPGGHPQSQAVLRGIVGRVEPRALEADLECGTPHDRQTPRRTRRRHDRRRTLARQQDAGRTRRRRRCLPRLDLRPTGRTGTLALDCRGRGNRTSRRPQGAMTIAGLPTRPVTATLSEAETACLAATLAAAGLDSRAGEP